MHFARAFALILFFSVAVYARVTDNSARHEGTGAAFCRSRNDFMTVASLSLPFPLAHPARRRVEEANAREYGSRGRAKGEEGEARIVKYNGGRKTIRRFALPRSTVLAVSAARRACRIARRGPVCMCVRAVAGTRVCVRRGRAGERREERRGKERRGGSE